jgi:transcriptional regulator with GAF, ATPase, and Fis domain
VERDSGDRETRRLLLEEAYALGLAGRAAEARAVAERLLALDADGADAAERLLAARATRSSGNVEPARACLEALLAGGGSGAWRAALELARIARADGRDRDAVELLGRAIAGFRADVPGEGPAASLLASLVSAEVEALAGRPGPGDEARASSGALPGGRNAPVPRGPDGPTGAPRPEAGVSAADPALLLRLVELGKRLAGEDDPDRVLGIVLHEAIALTGTERGFIVLVAGDDFEFSRAENLDRSEIDEPLLEVSRTLIRAVVRDGRPFVAVLPEASDPDPARRSLAEIGARSVACVPIVHDGAVAGVLYLDGRAASPALARSLDGILELLAAQAGAALANARAHRARSLALEAAEESLRRHRTESERRTGYGDIVGASDAMQEVYRRIDLVAATELPVLIVGETGTGKELVSRLIHARGPRAGREFVATNCAGVAETLLETELFGHERGAFTGADRARPGLFELAHRGTLFLDEIGDMSPRMQADLLRVIESGEVRRVGGRHTLRVDVRVVAATHRDLDEMQRRGEFRSDLFYRLNVLTMRLPPLRDRIEDVPLLVSELLARFTPRERAAPAVSERAMGRLLSHSWPGNVRELQNVLRRLSVLDVAAIDEHDLPEEILKPPARRRAGSLRRAEDDAVCRALDAAGGNKTEAARILGVDRKTLYAKLRRIERAGR